jgi:hypothetical protein
MKGMEDTEITKATDLIDEAMTFMANRRMLEARRRLNTLKILLTSAKDIPFNSDLQSQ